jgi:hypothetical protein
MNSAAKLAIGLFVGVVAFKTVSNFQKPVGSAQAAEATPAETPAARKAKVTIATNGDCKGAEPRAQHIAKSHPDWKPEGVALVACHEYAIGMTASMLRASLGSPETINSTETAGGTHEQWVYGRDYIYVEDGVVTSFQTSR